MADGWKRYIQYQKPQAAMLTALAPPLLAGVYNFGLRVLAVVALSMLVCVATEFAFTRRQGKPATMAALVTATLLALILPPNIPYWMVVAGAVFAILFGKMAFGGFGKNVFNPAMVGRCFLYISFPGALAATWWAPFHDGPPAGFARWTTTTRAASVDESAYRLDMTTSATTLQGTKRLNQDRKAALAEDKPEGARRALEGFDRVKLLPLFLGNINGSMGETSGLLILLGLGYLLWRRVVAIPLVVGPFIGFLIGKLFLRAIGADTLPFVESFLVTVLAGGTLFAVSFMITEPVSAPNKDAARWIYAALIGFFAMIIRTMSVFPAGLMFSILLGNMFAPIIEIGVVEFGKWRKARAEAAAAGGGS